VARSKVIAAIVAVWGALAAPGVAQAHDGSMRRAPQALVAEAGTPGGALGGPGLASTGLARPRTATDPVQPAIIDPILLAKCVGAIGAFIAGNALVIVKVRKAGGVIKVAKTLLQAGSAEARLKAAIAIFGDITGLAGLVENCS
jgi:hypothetical protein